MKKNKIWMVTAATGLVSLAESAFLRQRVASGGGMEEGFDRLSRNCSALLDLEIENAIAGSQYSTICVVAKPSLLKFIRGLLSREVREEITSKTGFSYAVDFFVFNENRHIPMDAQSAEHYANFWHTDEMFSAHCLKLFIPVEDIGVDDGAMNYLNASDTRELARRSYIRSPDVPAEFAARVMRLTGVRGDVSLVKPHVCLHRAGIPAPGVVRRQIMLQLNPARTWKVRSNIYELQRQREINLPFLRKFSATYEAL